MPSLAVGFPFFSFEKVTEVENMEAAPWYDNSPYAVIRTTDNRLYIPLETDEDCWVVEKLSERWLGSPNSFWQIIPSSKKNGCFYLKSLVVGRVLCADSDASLKFSKTDSKRDEDMWEIQGSTKECVLRNWKYPNCVLVGSISVYSPPDSTGKSSSPAKSSSPEPSRSQSATITAERMMLRALVVQAAADLKESNEAEGSLARKLEQTQEILDQERAKIAMLEHELRQHKQQLRFAIDDSTRVSHSRSKVVLAMKKHVSRLLEVETKLDAFERVSLSRAAGPLDRKLSTSSSGSVPSSPEFRRHTPNGAEPLPCLPESVSPRRRLLEGADCRASLVSASSDAGSSIACLSDLEDGDDAVSTSSGGHSSSQPYPVVGGSPSHGPKVAANEHPNCRICIRKREQAERKAALALASQLKA